MSLSMSSPFTLSCRRRSHSASSPSPSPVPASAWHPAHKRARSSHRDTPTLPCPLDSIWRSGKRPRRDISPVQPTRSSTPASADSLTASTCSSAPHTPLFPTSSADFLLFPSHHLSRGNLVHSPLSPSPAASYLQDDACEFSQSDLVRLRSAAFLELQRSVEENGEGFVKRMREFEDSRSKSVQHSRPRGAERRRRKRYSPSVPTTRVTRKTAASDDDDVLACSNDLSGESLCSRQKRSFSLGAMEDGDFQPRAETNSSGRLSPISSIFHPLAHYPPYAHPNMSNLSTQSFPFSTPLNFANSSHTSPFKPALSRSSDSFTSSEDLSNSYTEDVPYLSISPMVSPPRSPNNLSVPVTLPATSSADKAIAALALAMANGAGGLGDYEAVRALDASSTDESQVGELWH